MYIRCDKLKMGREPGMGWYVKGGNVTAWFTTLEEAFEHVSLNLK